MKKLELFLPVKPYTLNQGFGLNPALYAQFGINGHNGLDLATARGQIVRASHDGLVTFSGDDGSGGWGVVLRTLDKREYLNTEAYFKTIYWHFIPIIPVKAGQMVKAGDVIGYADSTGFSTGDHLHWGLKPVAQGENDWTWANIEQNNGYHGAIGPIPYLSKLYGGGFRGFLAILDSIRAKLELLKAGIKTLL